MFTIPRRSMLVSMRKCRAHVLSAVSTLIGITSCCQLFLSPSSTASNVKPPGELIALRAGRNAAPLCSTAFFVLHGSEDRRRRVRAVLRSRPLVMPHGRCPDLRAPAPRALHHDGGRVPQRAGDDQLLCFFMCTTPCRAKRQAHPILVPESLAWRLNSPDWAPEASHGCSHDRRASAAASRTSISRRLQLSAFGTLRGRRITNARQRSLRSLVIAAGCEWRSYLSAQARIALARPLLRAN